MNQADCQAGLYDNQMLASVLALWAISDHTNYQERGGMKLS